MSNSPASIDDVVNAPHAQNNTLSNTQHAGSLEKKIAEKPKDNGKWNWRQVGKDALKYSPILAANWLLSGGYGFLMGTKTFLQAASSLVSPMGYVTAKFILNKKEKKKTSWQDTKREIATGNIIGNIAYHLYQLPEKVVDYMNLDTTTTIGKVLKTAVFNPAMFFPFVAIYQPLVYIRDNIGTKEALKGIFNGKIFGYLKEAYEKGMKGKYLSTIRKGSMTLFPSHYLTIGEGLVTDPAARVGIGGVHDVVFATIAGSKKKENGNPEEKKSLYQKISTAGKSMVSPAKWKKGIDNFFRVPGYESAPKQNYATAGAH